ncbi:hypothetical protein AXG93_1433s1190 [Marchantia polymorpha subsp. ruderalis]|uniref:Uncharacterized protein n=1 Tax=Marchantia polymorpha subsp. ruderalis TaxID=1480154 RepID=A0A176W8T0_MARPO|nr:hypothetical protein AXG93_1433s1190 [Marchantia polymorpha subsp. ruderalis]
MGRKDPREDASHKVEVEGPRGRKRTGDAIMSPRQGSLDRHVSRRWRSEIEQFCCGPRPPVGNRRNMRHAGANLHILAPRLEEEGAGPGENGRERKESEGGAEIGDMISLDVRHPDPWAPESLPRGKWGPRVAINRAQVPQRSTPDRRYHSFTWDVIQLTDPVWPTGLRRWLAHTPRFTAGYGPGYGVRQMGASSCRKQRLNVVRAREEGHASKEGQNSAAEKEGGNRRRRAGSLGRDGRGGQGRGGEGGSATNKRRGARTRPD